MSLIVKICGLSTRETLAAALDAGADMVGFVFFPPSPRHLSLVAARDLGNQVQGRAAKVALTVDADDAMLGNIVEALRPDILQLHGKETVTRVRDIKQKFGLQVIKVIAIETAADLGALPGSLTWPTVSFSTPAHLPKPPGPAVSARRSTGVCWNKLS